MFMLLGLVRKTWLLYFSNTKVSQGMNNILSHLVKNKVQILSDADAN